LFRTLALAAVLTAALLAFMGSFGRTGLGRMEPSSFRGGAGYWLLAKDGGVFAFGDAKFFGPNRNQGNDIAGMAATATGQGYWTVDDDGDVFAYGDAKDYGSRPGPEIDDISGFAGRSQGDGYWMVSRDGAVYAFGAAQYFGSANTLRLSKPIVGMAATPSGQGYWLIAGDGGVFAYGDAQFFGSTGAIKLARPIIDFGPSPDGKGYRFIGSDGGVFSYGSAGFFGSTGAITLNQPIVGFAATASGNGYWLVGQDGGVFAFGDAQFYGSTGGIKLNSPIVAIVATPRVKIAPVANDDAATVVEDGSVTIPVEENDTHALPAAVSIESQPAHGSATLSGTKVVYTPAPNYSGSDTFKYKLTDTVGHAATGTVDVTVTPVNDAPTASGGSTRSATEDTVFTGSLNASDVDPGDTLTYSVVTGTTNGLLSLNASTGAFTYTPVANYNGPDSFTFKATDNHGVTSNTASVSIAVAAVNDLPTISAINDVTTPEDTATSTLSFTVGDIETAAGSLTLSHSSSNTTVVPDSDVNIAFGGTGANRNVTVTPAANANGGPVTITVTATDGDGGTITETFDVTVTAVNDTPVASNASPSTAEDTPLVSAVTAADADAGDTLTYGVVAGVAHGTLNLNTSTGAFTYTPAANHNGPDSFTFRATDSQNAVSNTATVSITVSAVNDLPTISAISDLTTLEDTATSALGFTIGDVETAVNSLTLSHSSSNPTLVPNTDVNIAFGGAAGNRNVTVTPAANQNGGPVTVTVTVTDGNGGTVTETFDVMVTAVNDTPVASNASRTTAEDSALTGNLVASDVDAGDTLTFVNVAGPSHGTVTVNADGSYTYTPAVNYNGPDSFTFKATDNAATPTDSNTATVSITVTAVNDAPVASNGSATTPTLTPILNGSLSATDVENDDLTYSLVTGPSDGILVLSDDGSFTYDPGAFHGTTSFTFKANDGTADSNTATFTITVNGSPVAADDADVTVLGTAIIDVRVNDSDPDDATIQLTVAANLSVTANNGTVACTSLGLCTYTAAPGFSGTDTFTYTLMDPFGATDTATVTITV
jgi:VCBS repeat-containing protein